MIIQTSNVKLNVQLFPSQKKNSLFVFLLHGFTGSSEDWEEIISLLPKNFSYVAVDLIGHGKSEAPDNVEHYKAQSVVQQLDDIFRYFSKKKFILIGYSLGGRAALTYAVHYPEKLSGLILESSTAGILNEHLREERRQNDAQIVKLIKEKTVEEFVEFWMNQDLFHSLKNAAKDRIVRYQKSKVKNQKVGLINSLKGFGTGEMPALYNKLHLIKCRTMLITGELDKKFTQLNSELVRLLPNAEHVIVKDAGHNVHLEKPQEFVEIVYGFITQF